MSAAARIKHLWNAAHSLQADNHTKKLIKSYYLANCTSIAKSTLEVPEDYFSHAQMCARCFMLWSEGDYQMKLVPHARVNTTRAKKLIAKLEQSKNDQLLATLTQKQKNRAKWFKKQQLTSYIEIHCQRCQHKTKIQLHKPKKKAIAAPAAVLQTHENIAQATKSKKHKKKDKTAGLKLELTAKPTTSSQLKTPQHKNNQTTSKDNKTQLPANNNTKAKTIQPVKAKPTTETINKHSQTITTKKHKNKKRNNTANQQQQQQPNIKSKTQQQNTILQLAALLKHQAKNKAPTANRLDMFLK